MNCCNNHKNKTGKGHSHLWMMALCCGAPILLLIGISWLGPNLPGFKAVLAGIAPFVCPLIMLLMLLPMLIRRKRHGEEDSSTPEETAEHKNSRSGLYLN